jgi:glycosyltransferase involved in cell wall biosynthesis
MRVSVALGTYNGAQWMDDLLGSLAGQTRLPDEVVICDDASQDETFELICKFALEAPFDVVIHQNEENLGVNGNYEKVISLCSGDIIIRSDQDDVWLPHKLARYADAFERDPGVGLVISNSSVVDSRLQPKGFTLWEKQKLSATEAARINDYTLPNLEYRVMGVGWGHNLAFRAHFVPFIVPVPSHWTYGWKADWWTAMLLAIISRPRLLDETLLLYRQHGRNITGAGVPKTKTQQIWDRFRRLSRSKHRNRSGSIRNTYDKHLQLRERLETVQQEAPHLATAPRSLESSISELDERLAHLQARSLICSSKVRNSPLVVQELVKGRYHRFSNGLVTLGLDLFS